MPSETDFGTRGAAVFAATQFLLDRKQEGIGRIKKRMMQLGPNGSVRVSEKMVRFSTGAGIASADPLLLNAYALTNGDVNGYLEPHGKDLGFFRSGDEDGVAVYVRWSVI